MVGFCGMCKKWYDDDAHLEFRMHLIAHHDGKDLRVTTVGKGTFKMEVAFTEGNGATMLLDPMPGHITGRVYEMMIADAKS